MRRRQGGGKVWRRQGEAEVRRGGDKAEVARRRVYSICHNLFILKSVILYYFNQTEVNL